MNAYLNLSGNSGVKAYQTGPDYIDVQFEDGSIFRYTYSSTGREAVEEMKNLAEAGKGLTGYISRYIRENYAVKLK